LEEPFQLVGGVVGCFHSGESELVVDGAKNSRCVHSKLGEML
jgi:hypothetical protein